jgi:hypothetical protein
MSVGAAVEFGRGGLSDFGRCEWISVALKGLFLQRRSSPYLVIIHGRGGGGEREDAQGGRSARLPITIQCGLDLFQYNPNTRFLLRRLIGTSLLERLLKVLNFGHISPQQRPPEIALVELHLVKNQIDVGQ